METMSANAGDDCALALFAEVILNASDEDITRVAIERGVDVGARDV
jgi:hypothetical protein